MQAYLNTTRTVIPQSAVLGTTLPRLLYGRLSKRDRHVRIILAKDLSTFVGMQQVSEIKRYIVALAEQQVASGSCTMHTWEA